jgi:hypothetical protein
VRSRPLSLLAALALVASIAPVLAQTTTTPSELKENPDRYDGKVVTVSGTVYRYREGVSRHDNPYTTFSLADQKAAVRVYSRRQEGLKNGMTVTVTGRFAKQRASGSYTFFNEVQADTIKPTEH